LRFLYTAPPVMTIPAFSTWLTAIALNTYRSAVRERPPVAFDLDPTRLRGEGQSALAGLERRERSDAVRRLVLTLPARYREPMVLTTARVLAAVEEVASAPPPLPFPWGRFTVAVIATCVCVACGLWLVRGLDLSPVVAALTDVGPELGYALLTILATLALIYAPRLGVTASATRARSRRL